LPSTQVEWAQRAWFEEQAKSSGATDVADYFGHAGNGYQRFRHARLEQALESVESELGRSAMLDVGCASGTLTSRIARKFNFSRAIGIDFVDTVLEEGRRHYPDVEFCAGTLPNLAFDDQTFDLVIASEVLYYLTPTARGDAVNEIVRVLAPGGHVLITAALGGPYLSLDEVRTLAGDRLDFRVQQLLHMVPYHRLTGPLYLAARLKPMLAGDMRPASAEMQAKFDRWHWLLRTWPARIAVAAVAYAGRPILASERIPRLIDRLGLGQPTNMIVVGRKTS
jgi:SAM-dependent methyltransferase